MWRPRNIAIALLVIAILAFAVREIRNQRAKTIAFAVVNELGGHIGSIPFEPLGTEYRISFRDREFTAEELGRLTVLNRLTGRNTVGVGFVDTNVTAEDIKKLRQRMPNVVLFRVVDGEAVHP